MSQFPKLLAEHGYWSESSAICLFLSYVGSRERSALRIGDSSAPVLTLAVSPPSLPQC